MPFQCEKRSLTLVWSILECIFFSGILNGWIWLQQIFKEDNYFIGNCNVTGVASRTEDVVSLTVPESKPPIITLNNERWVCVYEKVRIIQPEGHILTSILPSTVGTPTPQEVETITAVTVEDIVSQNSTEVLCWEQDDNLELFISLAFIIRNILMLPLGIFLDRYGTGRTRILAM